MNACAEILKQARRYFAVSNYIITKVKLHSKMLDKFKVCKSVHHHTVQINLPTRCNNLSILLLDVYLQLNMFWASSRPLSRAQQLQ